MKKMFMVLMVMMAVLQASAQRWTKEKANAWYSKVAWGAGADFLPATAINQLEMWQKETFDPATINRDLGYAAGIGMTYMRVYLHHLAWEIDKEGFKDRMKQYLAIADKHKIKTIFVFFDDCWNDTYKAGTQPAPKPGIHNSGWVQDPGVVQVDHALLEAYVKDVLTTFKKDKRILLWDLYNEPGNSKHGNKSMPLLQKVFSWGWAVRPDQPLSVGVWKLDLKELSKYQLDNSDVITYHDYQNDKKHFAFLDSVLVPTGRPMICTEYMARTNDSRFETILPELKKRKIIAINWGLVAGKSNTIYAWNTPIKDGSEPPVWFHDIFRQDGTPYKPAETALIKSLTAAK